MARPARLTSILTSLLLSWAGSSPCPAQAPSTPAAPIPAPTGAVPPASTQPETTPQVRSAGLPPPAPSPGQPSPPPLGPLGSPSPLPAIDGKAMTLAPPPLECTDHALPITLATALRLADARPVIVA